MEYILVLPNEEDEASRGNPPAKFHDRSEILRLSNPLLFCKREGSFHGGPDRHLSAEWLPVPSSGIEAPRPQAGASRARSGERKASKRNTVLLMPFPPARRQEPRPQRGACGVLAGQNSNSQPFPSLHSPPLQNISAAPGTHPLQEPMSPLASEIAGLVCPLH